jgi:hypothetical protein
LAAWLAVDQADGAAAGQHHHQAVGYARRSGSNTLGSRLVFGGMEDGRRFLNELPTHQEAHARARTSIAC